MRILVTGGAGFIGSHLCDRLVNQGHEVVSLDNYSTGSEKNHTHGVQYYKGDTQNIEKFKLGKFEIIFHLGEYSRVEQSFDEFSKVWNSNKLGTKSVIEYAAGHQSKLIYAGSSTKFVLDDESYIQSPYAWSKQSNTDLIKLYSIWYNLNYAITYFYNVYGPREIEEGKYATLIALFNKQIKEKEELTVVLPGTQTRNFTHVEDIVDGLIIVGEKGIGDRYGIGHSKSYSVLEVAEMYGGKINFLPERRGNRNGSLLDTSKVEFLGWKPKHELKEYIEISRRAAWQNI